MRKITTSAATTFVFTLFLVAAAATASPIHPNNSSFSFYSSTATENPNKSPSQTLMNRVKSATRQYCSCGASVLQSRFCKQDFAILAEVDPVNSRAFYSQQASHSKSGWPFSGVSIPVKVLHSVKGPLSQAQSHDIYFVRGGSCGVSSKSLPSRKSKYLLSGFRINFPGCGGPNSGCNLPSEIYVVTRCGWSQPADHLTVTQMAGLFLSMYKCGEGACSLQPTFSERRGSISTDSLDVCHYDYRKASCHSNFSICMRVRTGNGTSVCSLRAVRRLSSTQEILHRIPSNLHSLLRRERIVRTNDEERFSACIRQGQRSQG